MNRYELIAKTMRILFESRRAQMASDMLDALRCLTATQTDDLIDESLDANTSTWRSNWVCSTCWADLGNGDQPAEHVCAKPARPTPWAHYHFDGVTTYINGKASDQDPQPACECGSEKTFGPGAPHSSWCPKADRAG
jgi:hypothetical protein